MMNRDEEIDLKIFVHQSLKYIDEHPNESWEETEKVLREKLDKYFPDDK